MTAVLAVNAGSTSLKLPVLPGDDSVTGSADLPAPRGEADAASVKVALAGFGDVFADGHRIVHGGDIFSGPVRIDARVRQRLGVLGDLAPLHQPKSLAALDAVQAVLPDVPGVACFDTAFHATIPAAAATFALPSEWRQRWTLRRCWPPCAGTATLMGDRARRHHYHGLRHPADRSSGRFACHHQRGAPGSA